MSIMVYLIIPVNLVYMMILVIPLISVVLMNLMFLAKQLI